MSVIPHRADLAARRAEVIARLGPMVGPVRAEQRELAYELERIDAAITRTTITPTTPAVVVPIRRVRR